jgi:hypothetical protein
VSDIGTFSDLVANSWLDAVCNATAYSEAGVWVQLHIGDPGSAGTSNVAAETDRVQASFGAAASRAITTDAVTEWTNVNSTETLTWISLWDAATTGNFLGRDDLSSTAAVTAGDTFRIPTGDLDMSIT